jgi:hypothetical protein
VGIKAQDFGEREVQIEDIENPSNKNNATRHTNPGESKNIAFCRNET